jgi:hypothetical protein
MTNKIIKLIGSDPNMYLKLIESDPNMLPY